MSKKKTLTKNEQDVVRLLEGFLKDAKNGEMKGIAIVGYFQKKEVLMGKAGHQGAALVGGLEKIKQDILKYI